jgi:hypothetical protein
MDWPFLFFMTIARVDLPSKTHTSRILEKLEEQKTLCLS